MRILFLEAVQNFGGARKSTLELAKGLKNSGCEVLIVDFWGSCDPFVLEARKKELIIKFLDKRNSPLVLGNSNKLIQLKNYIKYFFIWRKYKHILNDIIEEFLPDFIVVNNTKTLSLLSKSKKYKVLFFARGWFLPTTISIFNKRIIRSKTDIFVGVSQSTRQAIYAGGFAKLDDIYVVSNSFDLCLKESVRESYKPLIPWHLETCSREFRIMHCGGFLVSKGQDMLIDLAKELISYDISFKIVVVGIIYVGKESEVFYNKLIKKISVENLEDKFEFILNESNVLRYFDQCDVLVHPSHTEGLPRVAMEAMAFGKPVIGNAVGGMTDYILHRFTGYLTNFNDIDDYVQAIVELNKNKKMYELLSINSVNLIKNSYTKENQIESFLKIFKK